VGVNRHRDWRFGVITDEVRTAMVLLKNYAKALGIRDMPINIDDPQYQNIDSLKVSKQISKEEFINAYKDMPRETYLHKLEEISNVGSLMLSSMFSERRLTNQTPNISKSDLL